MSEYTAEELAILAEVVRQASGPPPPELETLLTDSRYFGLATASPLQRAICRAVDGTGLRDLATHPHVLEAIGTILPGLPRPAEVAIVSGIRTAKSLLAAALAVHASQTCDLSRLGHGETPRVSVVSLKLDLAQVVHRHLVGNILAKPDLRALLVGEPTADSVVLLHPSGREVEIKVVAGARAGATLVARWSAGAIFDEAPRMCGQGDGVVNLDDMRAAVLGRLLPGAQILHVGSPWAPFGPVWEMVSRGWLKPTPQLLVVRAPGPRMNPTWWTPERCEQLQREDPDVYRTDVLAEFADPQETLFPLALLDAAVRPGPLELEYDPRCEYAAAMDPATRSNAWTLAIGTKDGARKRVVLVRQWIGSSAAPLSPEATLREVVAICARYKLSMVETDQYSGDAIRDLGAHLGLYIVIRDWTAQRKLEVFGRLRTEFAEHHVELPPDPQVRADLLGVRRRVTSTGVAIDLQRTPDGRHCDYAPSIALALGRFFQQNENVPPQKGTNERKNWEDEQQAQREIEQQRIDAAHPWYDK